jgi:mannose-6-phosphate isomerase-like protein (cupin superfamily)
MMTTLFEQNSGAYSVIDGYYILNLATPEHSEYEIRVWGLRRLDYLKKHRRGVYTDLLMSGKLSEHLHEIEMAAKEGQHLQVWGVGLRRAQKMSSGEVLALGPHASTRRHSHNETHETFYILMGEGAFVNDGHRIPCSAGSVCSVPVGMVHHVENTGDTPMLYFCVTTVAR